MGKLIHLCTVACLALFGLAGTLPASAEPLPREAIAELVVPPMQLGAPLNDKGVWSLLNSGGAQVGYVFETEPMAPLPGFSGAPINMLVLLDLEGRFIDVHLISHNEPIFVSGLGEAPFHKFFEQYRGHSIADTLVVGTPYGRTGAGSALVYLDGVTKATASVRIAHESLLAAVRIVAREKMQGLSAGPPAYPDPGYRETLSWDDLVAEGIASRMTVSNREIDAAFSGTLWARDDAEAQADPDGRYLDLWIIDLGPPSIAAAVLDAPSVATLERFLEIAPNDEPILVVETARHGLVSEDFVRNTAPDWLAATQDGLPVPIRDSDLSFGLRDDVAAAVGDGTMLILRTDRRLGFDPGREWVLHVEAIRAHGSFRPEIGRVTLDMPHATSARFFARAAAVAPVPPWRAALKTRAADLLVLGVFLAGLVAVLALGMNRMAGVALFTPLRLAILGVVVGFVGWWGQGQLSIVTVLAAIRTSWQGGSFAFLLYDPFSLLIWAVALGGLVVWGRGLFCGWLCPFGALQEFAHHLGRATGLRQIVLPERWDRRLKYVKYAFLAGLVGTVFFAPGAADKAVEVEPFKTAITTYFRREWYYVGYAGIWLVLGTVLFKGFCRYVCPLGAFFALAGLVRRRDWIARRPECGTPCQLCRVKCQYGAIAKSGAVNYSECFQCLDCVAIHDDAAQCVPLRLRARGTRPGNGVAVR